MDKKLYRGTIIRFSFNFDNPETESFLLTDNPDDAFPFQLIQISGYKIGAIAGYATKNIEVNNEIAMYPSVQLHI